VTLKGSEALLDGGALILLKGEGRKGGRVGVKEGERMS